MDEDDEFGDLYSDVFQPFQSPVVLPPPPPLPQRSIDLNLRSQDQDVAESNSASVSRVSGNDASKLSFTRSQDATRQTIGDGSGDDKDISFDIEEPDADSTPTIPGLFVAASESGALPGLATDRSVSQVTTRIEQVGGGDDGYGGQGEGDDWGSDSEDDLKIVLNDSSRDFMIGGADRRSRMGDNEDEDDEDDDEEPLVIVADTDPNQPMEEQLWGEDGLQGVEGDGKDGGEAGKGSGPGGVAGPPKAGYSSHGYHPFHSQFKVSVDATLLSLVRLLSSWDFCRDPVLAFVNSECISPLYLYLNQNAMQSVLIREIGVYFYILTHHFFTCLPKAECLVII